MRDTASPAPVPEPIAVVGIGCRFPGGAHGWRAYWRLLAEGRSAIGPVPPDRWTLDRHYDADPDAAAQLYVREGGFLTEPVDRFDAAAFGISPREAAAMDPQQRILLEVAAEALEDAGIARSALAGTETGVYAGAFALDYQALALRPENAHLAGPNTAAGMTLAAIANRLSHALDLHGPSVAFDTACSASLTALHYACRDLRDGACEAAICGGVNVMLLPEFVMALCRGRFLSPGSRSRVFDAAADGYVRGEGAGLVVLKTLSRAVADGDPVHALIRASGLNQDGRTEGFSRPSRGAQQALLRRVYGAAGIAPAEVAFVETHGTGTSAGDRAEAEALGAVFGPGRAPGAALLLGAAKASVGHLEAAAGMAGLIKAILSLRYGEVSGNPMLQTPNPAIDFLGLKLRVPRTAEPLPPSDRARLAGVNGFGYGGANAHVVVEEAPATAPRPGGAAQAEPAVLLLSAGDEACLARLARHHAASLQGSPVRWRDHCLAAATARDPQPVRLALVAGSPEDAAARLEAVAGGVADPAAQAGRAEPDPGAPVLVFTGMGAQHAGMADGLAEAEPAFRDALDEVDAIFRDGWSVSPAGLLRSRTDPTAADVAQWTNFALQVALCRLLESWGVGCAAVVGHSAGEVAAAWRCGALTLADAASVAFHRGRLLARLSGRGGLLAAAMAPEEARAIAGQGALDLAAVNAPGLVTLSGPADELSAVADRLQAQGRFARKLAVDVPYHGRAVRAVLPELAEALAGLMPSAPALRWVSSVDPEADLPLADARYWARNVREPVLLAAAAERLMADGRRLFLEVGPHPVLGAALAETAAAAGCRIRRVGTLHRERPAPEAVLASVGGLFIAGAEVDWRAVNRHGRRVNGALPLPLWADTRFFTESPTSAAGRIGPRPHPLLGDRQPGPVAAWRSRISPRRPGLLADHRVAGRCVFPASAYIEMALAARRALDGDGPVVLDAVRFLRPLSLSDGQETALATFVGEDGETVSISAAVWPADPGSAWTEHAAMRALPWPGLRPPRVDLAAARKAAPARRGPGALHATLAAAGLSYGPAFRRLRGLSVGDTVAVAEIAVDETGCALDPCILDAAFQAALALRAAERVGLVLPESVARVTVFASPRTDAVAVVRARVADDVGLAADIDICAPDGGVLVRLQGLRCAVLPSARAERADWLYRSRWTPVEFGRHEIAGDPAWLLASDDDALCGRLAGLAPGRFERVAPGDAVGRVGEGAERVIWDAGAVRDGPAAAQAALDLGVAFGAREGRLIAVTREALVAASGDTAAGFLGGSVWGALRSLALDRPSLSVRLVDLPARHGRADAQALVRLCDHPTGPGEVALRSGAVLAHRLGRLTDAEIMAESLRPATPGAGDHVVLDQSGAAPVWRQVEASGGSGLEILSARAAPGFPGRFDALARPEGSREGGDLALSGDRRLLASRLEWPAEGVACVSLAGPAAGPPGVTAWLSADRALSAEPPRNGAAIVLILGDGELAEAAAALCAARGYRPHLVARPQEPCRLRRSGAAAIHDPDRPVSLDRLRRVLASRGGGRVLTLEDIGLPIARCLRRDVSPAQWRVLEPPSGAPADFAAPALAPPVPLAATSAPKPADLVCGASDSAPRVEIWGRRLLAAPRRGPAFAAEGAAVLTGGLTGVGAEIAPWLARNGAHRIALLGRRGPSTPGASELIAALRRKGAEPLALSCDVAEPGALDEALDRVRARFGPIETVAHAAAAVEATLPEDADLAAFEAAFGAKVGGALALDRLTRGDPVRRFLLVGSLVGVLGNRSQAPYAAANAVLWSLAERRRAEGLPVLTLAMGALAGSGAAARDPAVAARFQAVGLGLMDPREVLDACLPVLDAPAIRHLVVADLDWRRLPQRPGSPAERLSRDAGEDAARGDLCNLPAAELARRMRGIVSAALASVTGLADPDERGSVTRLGLDSLMATEASLSIQDVSGLAIDPIDVLSAPSVDALAGRLVDLVDRRRAAGIAPP